MSQCYLFRYLQNVEKKIGTVLLLLRTPPLKTASGGQISEIGTILIVVIFSSSTFLGYLNSFKNHQKHHILPFEIGLRHSYIPKISRLRRARYYLNSCHFSSFNIFQYYLNKAGVLNSNRTVVGFYQKSKSTFTPINLSKSIRLPILSGMEPVKLLLFKYK